MAIKTKIKKQDLKIYPAERLTDTDDGGGLMASSPLTGAENELFPPIDRVTFAKGGLDIRKIYPAVMRPDDEPLLGAHLIIGKPSSHPDVSFLLFRGESHGEERKDVIKRIEGYSVDTIESRLTLLGTQARGSRLVQAYQRVEDPLPEIGQIYSLKQDYPGYENYRQPIQIQDVQSEVRTFNRDYNGQSVEFQRRVVSLTTTAALELSFVGIPYPSQFYVDSVPCQIVETAVADAGKYYGIKPLTAAIAAATNQIKVSDVKDKIVPTNRVETRYADRQPIAATQVIDAGRAGSDGEINYTLSSASTGQNGRIWQLGAPFIAGSLSAFYSSNTTPVLTDNGNGQWLQGDTVVADLNYATGEITFVTNTTTISRLRFRPAVMPVTTGETALIDIKQNNVASNYVVTLTPIPGLQSLVIYYRTQGNWIRLAENADGTISGDIESYGVGTLNRATGTVQLDLKTNLPDIGSALVFSWAPTTTYNNRADNTAIEVAKTVIQLASTFTAPNTVNLSWGDGTNTYTISDDGNGAINGNGITGRVDYRNNQLILAHDNLPPASADYTVDYDEVANQQDVINPGPRNGSGEYTLALGANTAPHSVKLTTSALDSNGVSYDIDFTDDGNGNITSTDGNTHGSIDYASGTCLINPDVSLYVWGTQNERVRIYTPSSGAPGAGKIGWRVVTRQTRILAGLIHNGAPIEVTYAAATGTPRTETHTVDTLTLDLTPGYSEQVVPGSVFFTLGDRMYFSRDAQLFSSQDITNGTSTLAGSIDYASGKVEITNWAAGDTANFSMRALLTIPIPAAVAELAFIIPSAPVVPGALQVRATAVDGTLIDVNADATGNIDGTGIIGALQSDTGAATVQFGEWVTAAGNETQPWYQPELVENGQIFKPIPVYADTIKYNAVSYASMPLDAQIIGINPATLPIDGRVPIYRVGDMVVVHASWSQDIAAPLPGAVVQLNVTDLDSICLQDANTTPVLIDHYDYDLSAGTLTFADPLDLSAYELPLTVNYGHNEEAVITRIDSDNTLHVNRQLRRSYDPANTFVSSAMLFGELQVRATKPFTQASWNDVWSDERTTDAILFQLDTRNYPIGLTDDGAIPERWVGIMQNGTQFHFFGESIGFVGTGDQLAEFAPINPATGKPYLTLPLGIFGDTATNQWPPGSVFRLNTFATAPPVWSLRAAQPSSVQQTHNDSVSYCLRGDTVEDPTP